MNVPYNQGMVDRATFRQKIDTLPLTTPATLHLEYSLGGAELGRRDADITPEIMMQALQVNLAALHRTLA